MYAQFPFMLSGTVRPMPGESYTAMVSRLGGKIVDKIESARAIYHCEIPKEYIDSIASHDVEHVIPLGYHRQLDNIERKLDQIYVLLRDLGTSQIK